MQLPQDDKMGTKLNTDPTFGRLPPGRHFAVTWGIPEEFGGRTNAMLHRSRSFASAGGRPVDILTFDDFRDYSVLRGVLRERGFLSEETRILNLWEELPAMAEFVGSKSRPVQTEPTTSFHPLSAQKDPELVELEGPHRRLVRYAEDGRTQLQVDHYRADGSLFLSDRHDARLMGTHGGRSLTLADRSGQPLQTWGSAWALYRSWLDFVIGDEQAFLVVDNKNIANFMSTYQRDNAVVFYTVHENHLENPTAGFASEMNSSAQKVFTRLDSFDGVVFLTEQQESDARKRLSNVENTYVIPNGRSVEAAPESGSTRKNRSGMQAARLVHLKRVDHSIRAVHRANALVSNPVELRVFGDGSRRGPLEQLIVELNETDHVRLMGHVPNAQSQFKEASFSLLTSTSEAFGLVIVESMAAGCIPIAYDLPYGPASIITHGVDGFLVEYGNIEELANCIAAFVDLPPNRQEQMRSAARRRADDFSDEHVVSLWAETFKDAAAKKSLPMPKFAVSILNTTCGLWTDGSLEIRLAIEIKHEIVSAERLPFRFSCRLKTRDSDGFFRVDGEAHPSASQENYEISFRFNRDLTESMNKSIMDANLETQLQGRRISTRIPLFSSVPAGIEARATVHGNLSFSPSKLVPTAPAPSAV